MFVLPHASVLVVERTENVKLLSQWEPSMPLRKVAVMRLVPPVALVVTAPASWMSTVVPEATENAADGVTLVFASKTALVLVV